MDGTIISQGRFTSAGTAQTIQIRSDVDWMEVTNFTETTAQTGNHGVSYRWQRGLATNNGFVTLRNAGATAVDARTSASLGVDGFTLVDTSVATLSAPVAITAISNVGVVATGNTAGVSVGSIVRLASAVGALQLCGIDFTVTAVIANTSFTIRVPANMVAANAPGANAVYRIVGFNPMFYPRRRTILRITQAAQAVITTSVDHGYTVGQDIRIVVPTTSAMTQINNLAGTVVAVTASTFTVAIDSTAFTAFAFPLTAAVPFTPAEATPFGEDTATALQLAVNVLGDATLNTGFIGMILGAGITSPAGSNGDVVYWTAGKSFSVDNQ